MSVASMAATMSAQITHMNMKQLKLEQDVAHVKKLKEKTQDESLSILARLDEYDERNKNIHKDLNAITMGGVCSLKTHMQQLRAMNSAAKTDTTQVSKHLDIDSEVKDVLEVSSVEAITASIASITEEFKEKVSLASQKKEEQVSILNEMSNQIEELDRRLEIKSDEEQQMREVVNKVSQKVESSIDQVKELRERIRITKDQCARSEKEALRLQHEFDEKTSAFQSQKDAQSLKLEGIKAEITKVNENIESKIENIKLFTEAIVMAKDREQDLNHLIQTTKEDFDEEKNKLEQVKSNLQQQSLLAQAELKTSEDHNQNSKNSIEQNKETLVAKQQDLAKMQEKIQKKKNELSELTEKHIEMHKRETDLQDSIKLTTKEHSAVQEEATLQINELKETILKQKESLTVVEDRESLLTTEIRQEEDRLISKKQEFERLKEEAEQRISNVNGNLKLLQEQNHQANTQVPILQEAIATKRNELTGMKDELEQAERILEETTLLVKKQLRENQATQELDVIAGKEQAEKERELENLKLQLEKDSQEYQDEVVMERKEAKKKLDAKKAEVAEVSQQRKELEKKLKANHQLLAQKSMSKERTRKHKKNALDKEIASAKKALAKSEKALAKQKKCLEQVKTSRASGIE